MHALCCSELDGLLAPLASSLRRDADALIDFRTEALQGREAGRCVACFFRLAAAARSAAPSINLDPLRDWLRSRILILARDADGKPLETLPADLTAPDLETCCEDAIREMLENRTYATPRIGLIFAFKAPAEAEVAVA